MKQVFIVISIGLLLSISCKKEKSCERCILSNKPPVAIAGIDTVITLPNDSALLNGSTSKDSDGTIEEWRWRKISGPSSFAINNTNAAKTIVKHLTEGIYQFELIIKDNENLSAKDTIQITVNKAIQLNHPPVADTGPDQVIYLPANSITLDGSASFDPDNNITNYSWTKISGPSSFSIINPNSVQAQVTGFGVYQFELTVTDAGGLFDKDTVQVEIKPEVN